MSTILVIDDDPALHHLIEGAVATDGFRLLHAVTAEAAFSLLARHDCQLLILDHAIDHSGRGIDTQSFLKEVRQIHPALKMILIARATPASIVLTALTSKACDLLVQPLTTIDLQTAIHAALEECRLPEIEVLSAQQHWIQLRLPCDLNAVPVLQKLLSQLQADLPEETRDGVAYAFREMLNNAIEHGGRLDPAKQVEILCIRLRHAIIYWIKDPGEGFNPEQLAHAAVSNPDHDPFRHVLVRDEKGLRAGGFGILLTNQLVDELVYNERRNELMFIKYLEPPGWGPQSG